METVSFWGRSYIQLRSLPPEVQLAFEWAILELEQAPDSFPARSTGPVVTSTETLDGPSGLRRIRVNRTPGDSGFRGIYVAGRRAVVFLRFARRDPQTYLRIDRAARAALFEFGLKPGDP